MNNKFVLVILGFVMGIMISAFMYLYSEFVKTTSKEVNSVNHSIHNMEGMPSMNSMFENYSDDEYLRLMIFHHQDALDMANKALKESKNTFIIDLSNNIIKTQSEEISQMSTELQRIVQER